MDYDMELEEGEACSYRLDGDIGGLDNSVDPDVDLAYIGDRLQHVLGHFQKDFEGGFSAENLGAKFGGYGSFLPSYQRSPALTSSPSNPDDASKPSRTSHLKEGHNGTLVSHPEHHKARCITGCSSSREVARVMDLAEREGPLQSVMHEDIDSQHEYTKLSKPKKMKLRCKADSNNVSSQKKEAIYDGLGLGASPASSMEESQSGSQEMLFEHQGSPLESPTSILQIMTSFPVGDMLLSPLPEYLLTFSKMQPQENPRPVIVSGLGAHGSNYLKDILKVPQSKKVKSREGDRKHSMNSNAVFGRKKSSSDDLSKDIVSRNLQLPQSSNGETTQDNMTRSSDDAFDKTRKANECTSREKRFNILLAEETLNPKRMLDCTGTEKQEDWQSEGFIDDREEIPVSVSLAQPKKGNHDKGGDNYDNIASPRKKDHLNALGMNIKASSKGKETSKESQGQITLVTDGSVGSMSDFSTKNKSMKSKHGRDSKSKTKLGKLKGDGCFQNERDIYKDFFGDVTYEEEDQQKLSLDSKTVQRCMPGFGSEQRKKSKGKVNAKLSTTKSHLVAATGVVPGSGDSMPCAVSTLESLCADENSGIYCVKCRKWRLLPPGTNRRNLPGGWICSMMNWLPPGMNACNVSQEETTNAAIAMLQTTSPDALNHPNGNQRLSNLVSGSPHHDETDMQDLQALPSESNAKGSAEVSDLGKKGMAVSSNKNLKDVFHSSLEAGCDVQQPREPSRGRTAPAPAADTGKVSKRSSKGGDILKSKARRGHDQDNSKLSKIARKMETSHSDEDWTMDHGGHSRRIGKNSVNTSLAEIPNGNQKSYHKDLDFSADDTFRKPLMVDHSCRKAAASEFVEGRVPDEGESVTKGRKTKESQGYPTSLSHLPRGNHENGAPGGESDFEGVQARKVKYDFNGIRREQRIDKESGRIMTMRSNNYPETTGLASMERETGLMQLPAVAASCSSMASGSVKSKEHFHETKGSPAESVSSSPLRSSKPNNLTSERERFTEKHDFEDAVMVPIGSMSAYSARELVGQGDLSRSDGCDGSAAVVPNGSNESSVLEPDKDNFSGNNDKAKAAPSPELSNHVASHSRGNWYPTKSLNSDKCPTEERKDLKSCSGDILNGMESGKVPSAGCGDKHQKSQAESMENSRIPGDTDIEESIRDVKDDEAKCRHIKKKDIAGHPSWTSGTKTQSNLGDARCRNTVVSIPSSDDRELPLRISSGKSEQVDVVCGTEKALDSSKQISQCPGSNGVDDQHVSRSNGSDALQAPRHIKKVNYHNAIQQKSSCHVASTGHRIRDINAPSPARRDCMSHAAVNALKEAKDLKHLADRLKNGGSNGESIGLYFQAALKFLHGATLMEPSNNESSKRGDIAQSIQIYSSTAKLCEFCAHEYEKSKDMASAALAYKCMEVAYLKVVYSSDNNATNDRQELQTALKMIPPGISPASSSSDVDNVNNTANIEMVGQSKDARSPQVAGNQVIAATKKTNFVQFLKFAQDVSNAMEASRKSMIAFSAASASSGDPKLKEALSCTKTALDYHFLDVEGLLKLVRVATEAIGR